MPSGLQRGLKGGHEVLALLHGCMSVLSRHASRTAGQCTVHQPSRGLLASEAAWTINRDKLKGWSYCGAQMWWTCRAPSLRRHVHRECMRKAALNLSPIIPATACHQSNDVERYRWFSVPGLVRPL